MTSKKILVSAIVSTYNSEKFIRGKIEDLLAQTIGAQLEIVIVNSGSRQNEDRIIQEYINKYEMIKYIRTDERETIYKAWNRAIKISTGKYITNSNTDDRLKADAYEILSSELERNHDLGLVYANQFISHVPNQKFTEITKKKVWSIPKFDLLTHLDRCVVLSQPMWRASIHFEQNIWFNDELEICGDHDFVLRLLKHYKISYLPTSLGTFYVDKKKANKSLQNMTTLEKEKNGMTSDYIKEYVKNIDETTLAELQLRFFSLAKLPVKYLRGRNYLLNKMFPLTHTFTSEFVFYVYALILERRGEIDKAIACCTKILKHKHSDRVSNLLCELKKNNNENITNK